MNATYTHPNDCGCYKCVGPQYEYHDGHRFVWNNMEHHTFGEPCAECGMPKTEYRDLGTKGRFVCWWCRDRVAGFEEVPP